MRFSIVNAVGFVPAVVSSAYPNLIPTVEIIMLSHGFLSALLYHYSTDRHSFSPIYDCKASRPRGKIIFSEEVHLLCSAPVALFASQLRFGLRLQTAFPLNSAIILCMLCNITYRRHSDNYAFITLSDFTSLRHFLVLLSV